MLSSYYRATFIFTCGGIKEKALVKPLSFSLVRITILWAERRRLGNVIKLSNLEFSEVSWVQSCQFSYFWNVRVTLSAGSLDISHRMNEIKSRYGVVKLSSLFRLFHWNLLKERRTWSLYGPFFI